MAELKTYKYEKMISYPHLRIEEATIWNRFIDKYPDYFQQVAYDVLVGTPTKPKIEYSPNLMKMWEYLTKKKIDVLGISERKAYVIEIEPNADVRGIGEVMAKRDLFKEEYVGYSNYYAMLITNYEKPDMRKLCASYDIIYYVV